MNILDFIFPKYCLECRKSGEYICDECFKKVTPCLAGRQAARCDLFNYSVFKYEGVIRKAIISLKYKFAYDLSQELVERILERIRNDDLRFKDVALVSIPLHKQRENWRGFNQAKIIGEKLAKAMNWKYIPDLLIRTKRTTPQVGLRGSARRSNLSGVFAVNPDYILSTKSSILIFDDVFTTGSTVNEARKVLKETGFTNIKSLTIAR